MITKSNFTMKRSFRKEQDKLQTTKKACRLFWKNVNPISKANRSETNFKTFLAKPQKIKHHFTMQIQTAHFTPPTDLRSQFLIRPDITYLNFGSYGACTKPVFRRYQQFQLELEQE